MLLYSSRISNVSVVIFVIIFFITYNKKSMDSAIVIVVVITIVFLVILISIYIFFKTPFVYQEVKRILNVPHVAIGNKIDNTKTIGIVISRYNEDLDYLDILKKCHPNVNLYIYNKGYDIQGINSIKLENVGTCDHTYLYHIIQNYDRLDDVTYFLPGSCFIKNKKELTNILLEYGHQYDYIFTFKRREENLHNFTIDEYQCVDKRNRGSGTDLVICPIRPYSKWYQEVMNKELTSNITNCKGIFSASKEIIKNRSKDQYIKIIEYLSKDKRSEAAHFVERLWYNLLTFK